MGPDTLARLRAMAALGLVVCAWGAAGDRVRPGYPDQVTATLSAAGATLRCLGCTAAGAPRHPLYLPAEAGLQPWPARVGR